MIHTTVEDSKIVVVEEDSEEDLVHPSPKISTLSKKTPKIKLVYRCKFFFVYGVMHMA
jgi:hypothetical protein